MSNGPIRPSTIDGVKRLAKVIKARDGRSHAEALDAAAEAGGFLSYKQARRQMRQDDPCANAAYVSVTWRAAGSGRTGREILSVRVPTPLDTLVRPHHLRAACHLGGFRFAASDHLDHEHSVESQSEARRLACSVARTLTFMQATGLRPSASGSRAYPRRDFRNAMPGHDHGSVWYDPATRVHVLVDEPYSQHQGGIDADRLSWARRHGWAIERSRWAGMYRAEGDCALYLAAEAAKGLDLEAMRHRLDALPPASDERRWEGRSTPLWPAFASPAAMSADRSARPAFRQQGQDSVGTVGYRPPLSRCERRRPDARMPIEAHAKVALLLRSAVSGSGLRGSAHKLVSGVRCDLDDWVQCEYGHAELPDEVFHGLYCGGAPGRQEGVAKPAQVIAALHEARRTLVQHYPDCAPLKALLTAIDRSIVALQGS